MRRSLLIAFVLLITHAALLPTFASADITHGLIGWWKFDEGTSTKAHDFSGFGNTGTFIGSPPPAWVSGKYGQALNMIGGSTNYVDAGAMNSLNGLTQFTVSAWIKGTVDAGSPDGNVVNRSFNLNINSSTGYADFEIDYGGGWTSEATNNSKKVNDGQWHHVVGTYDATTFKLYVDGVDNGSGDGVDAGQTWRTGYTLEIGSCAGNLGCDGSGEHWKGLIDDVRIYNRALSAADVAQLYASGETIIRKPLNNLGLIGYWNFNEGTSTIEHDFSGLGHIATSSTTGSTKPQWVSGKFGYGLLFDGSSSYVNTNSIANNIATGAFSVALWFKLAAPISVGNPGPAQDLFSLADASSRNDVHLVFNNIAIIPGSCDSGYLCGLEVTSAETSFQSSTSSQSSWAANTWYHAVYTFDTTSGGKLYVNGSLSGSNMSNTRGGTASHWLLSAEIQILQPTASLRLTASSTTSASTTARFHRTK